MKFEEYITKLKEKYIVEEKGDGVYKISNNDRELVTSENHMYDFSFIDRFFNSSMPQVSPPKVDNVFSREVLGEDDLSLRDSDFYLDFGDSGTFGRIGEDDLLPSIGHKNLLKGKKKNVRGSIPSPSSSIFNPHKQSKEEDSDDNPFIKKDPINPMKGKKDPDPDHFKKPGDNSNDFYY